MRLDARLARSTVSARGDLDRARRQLRDLLRPRDPRRACVSSTRTPRPRRLRACSCPEHTDMVWHGYLPRHPAGPVVWIPRARPIRPGGRHRFNPNKIVVDPYAKAIGRPVRWDDSMFGYEIGDPEADLSFDTRDNARVCAAGGASSIRRSPGATTGRRARRGTGRSSTRCTSRASRKLHPAFPSGCAAPTKR